MRRESCLPERGLKGGGGEGKEYFTNEEHKKVKEEIHLGMRERGILQTKIS